MALEVDWFADSKALRGRAQKHYDEFMGHVWRDSSGKLWDIREYLIDGSDLFTYALIWNRALLKTSKPILADAANNLVHSLDQLVGAVARQRGHGRLRDISFPWVFGEARFAAALRGMTRYVGAQTNSAIESVQNRHRRFLPKIEALKHISNSSKHWELIASTSSALAISVHRPQHMIWQVPPDAFASSDRYDFATGVARMSESAFQVVLRLEVEGLGGDVPITPDHMFQAAFRYADDMIEAVIAASG